MDSSAQAIRETLDALAVLERNLPMVSRILEGAAQFLPVLSGVTAPSTASQASSVRPPAWKGAHGKAPKVWGDRVVTIMQDAGSPVEPKAISAEYERRGWPKPKHGDIGRAIRGVLQFLRAKKKLVVLNKDGFWELV